MSVLGNAFVKAAIDRNAKRSSSYAAERLAPPAAKVLVGKKSNYLKVDKTVKKVIDLYKKGGDVSVPELLEAVNKAIPGVNKMLDFMEESKERGMYTPVYDKLTSSGYTRTRKVGYGKGDTRVETTGAGYLTRDRFKNFRMTKFSMVDEGDSLEYELLRQDLLEAVDYITAIAYSGETNKTQIQRKQKNYEDKLLEELKSYAFKELDTDVVRKFDWNKTRYAIQHNKRKISTFWSAVRNLIDNNADNPNFSSDTALSVVFELTFRTATLYNEINDSSGISADSRDSLRRDIMQGAAKDWSLDYETIANLAESYYDEIRTFVEGRRYL